MIASHALQETSDPRLKRRLRIGLPARAHCRLNLGLAARCDLVDLFQPCTSDLPATSRAQPEPITMQFLMI